jgi:nitrogen fixation NifU-like protein
MDIELYTEHVLEHARRPNNNKKLEKVFFAKVDNPVCGDELTLYLDVKNDIVCEASFEVSGCALSCASGSLCTDFFNGKTLSELRLITPGDIYTLFMIPINPNRTNCVLLTYSALQEYLKKS